MSNSSQKTRVIAYIDGFNLYYGIKTACKKHDLDVRKTASGKNQYLSRSIYWLDLDRLVRSYLKSAEVCVQIKYFSAPRIVSKKTRLSADQKITQQRSNERQSKYLDAVDLNPLITVELGKYIEKNPFRFGCRDCSTDYQSPNYEEKMTDTYMATRIVQDAIRGEFDTAMIISADSDMVPPIKAAKEEGKRVVVGIPPSKKKSDHIENFADSTFKIGIENCIDKRLPDVIERDGLPCLECPKEWLPTQEWVWDD